ncbi:MAG: efflux transporter outer membrane subunit [Bauldia sp.]|uniref:efflux transporter outer membrane subunit n=1 Tax=Bauldia sp. TaxID=2575872 RepID=UPI001E0578AC|nr:efflux transporter outer membrane subunit [Bauldia sp.]MCB1497000.1 efflux transporter outer membrane subunit [Bauldia sp.]
MSVAGVAAAAGRILVPIIAGSVMAGCVMVGPDFFTPTVATKAGWQPSNRQDPTVSQRREPSIEWWRRFNDATLNKLVAMAYEQNLTVRAAGVRIYEARAQLGIVIGDQFPQSQSVGAGYKAERVSKDVGILKTVSKIVDFDPTFQDWSAGFDAGWELDLWGQVRRGIQSASANLVAKIADYDDVLITVTGDVATAYITIRELQDELALARQNVNLQTESLRITQLRLKNGVTTELDVDEATALLNNTKAEIPSLESDLAKAKNALAVLLGVPAGQIDAAVDRPGPIPRPPAEVGIGIPADLLRRRPDIRAAEMRAAAQSAQIGVAKADLYPQFTISGAIGFKATDLSDLFTGKSFTGLINPGITWNFLNYGRIRNNVRVQDARYQALIVEYQQAVLKAYAEAEDALTAFLKSKQQAVYLARAATSAKKAARIALQQYQEGTADYSRVLNTQTTQLRTEQRLAAVRADVSTNLVALYKALGGGWQPANERPFIPEATKEQMAGRTNWGKLLNEDAIPQDDRQLLVPPSPKENPRRYLSADW